MINRVISNATTVGLYYLYICTIVTNVFIFKSLVQNIHTAFAS